MKRSYAPFLAALVAVLVLGPAAPADARVSACYTAQEYEAEQALRIHSELMVIGLSCQRMPGAGNIYGRYRQFTDRNKAFFRGYEDEIINYFRRTGAANPEGSFHALRTNLANDISTQATTMRVDRFCRQFMPVLNQALTLSQTDLRQWVVSSQNRRNPSTLPMCQ